jgi:hypothetical protein
MSLTKTTYSMIYSQPVNVADFGAYGDGKHDDTAAIQAAIDAAGRLLPDTFPPSVQMTFVNTSRPPPVVFLPPGTYRITDTLNLYTGMTLMGLNDIAYTVESTRLIMDTATNLPVATGNEPGGVVNLNKPILNLTKTYIPTGTVLSNSVTCTIANIGFWILNPLGTIAQRGGIGFGVAPSGLGSSGTGSAIYCDEQMIDSRIKRCNFYAIPNAAIWLDGTGLGTKTPKNVEIEECEFDGPIVSVRMDNVASALVCNNSLFFSGSFQIYANDVTGFIKATGCQFTYNARIKVAPATLDEFLLVGNRFEGGANGTVLDVNKSKVVTIDGNSFILSVESTINIIASDGGVISNNTITDSGYNAPLVTPTASAYGAIRLVGCQNVVVEGNSVTTPGSVSGVFNNFGIFSLDGTLPSKNVFSNNFVSGVYNGAGYRGQARRINVADGDVVSDNYTGNPDIVTPEWRIHDGWGGRISLYRQGQTSTSGTSDFDVSKFAQAKLVFHFAALSTADQVMLEVLVGRAHTTGAYVILNVLDDGVAGAGLGPHTVSAGNTVTFSISGTNLRTTYAITTDPILTSIQFSGAKHINA